MATVLISEPHADTRTLLGFVARRLGHEPVTADGTYSQVAAADVLLVEPGDAVALDLARWARANVPALPIVCTSIFPAGAEASELRPDAYLVKPFALHELECALRVVLARAAHERGELPAA